MTTAIDALAAPFEAAMLETSDTIPKDIALGDLVFNGKKLKSNITDAVLAADMRRTIEGASELNFTLADPSLSILNSGIFEDGGNIVVDELGFTLARIGKTNRQLALTFEDREVAKLRTYKKPRKAYRDKITRANFARLLVREAKTVKFFTANSITPGFTKNESIKIRGKRGTAEQRKVMHRVLAAGRAGGASRPVLQAAALVCAADANGRNGTIGTMVGAFAQGSRWGTVAQRKNIEKAAVKFYAAATRIYKAHPNWTPARIAHGVYASRKLANYNRWMPEAKANVKTWLGIENPDTVFDRKVKTERFAFSRGKPGGPRGENTWQCLQRLATEVGWRCFMVRGTVWFVSEEHLFKMKPVATVTPTTVGVDDVDFNNDTGRPTSDCKITARVGRWLAQPGSVIIIDGYGVADGRWIVVETNRSLFSNTMIITVRKPIPKLPEPRPTVIRTVTQTHVSLPSGGSSLPSSGSPFEPGSLVPPNGSVPEAIRKAYAKAVSINHKYPYVWGGGHGLTPGPSGSSPEGQRGLDCSGAVSVVLGASGWLLGTKTSVGFKSWGYPGEGKYMTVWTNNEHVWIEFRKPPGSVKSFLGGEHWGTGRWGTTKSGFGHKSIMHPKSGFIPRHIKGM